MADGVEANALGRAAGALKASFHRAVPSHLGNDAVGLAGRVFRSGRDGRHTVMFAALNVLATPVDLLLARQEAARYADSTAPQLPLIFVCGAARSGTTVVASALIRALPVSYFTNVTAVFTRAPITASAMLGLAPANDRVSTRSLYGRTAGWRGASDALPLWDRWLGDDRRHMPADLPDQTQTNMVSFFGAYEAWTGRPLVAKNNSLNAVAHLIAAVLPTSHFICVDRDPVFLAQSLLEARAFIYGDTSRPYGLAPDDPADQDPVAGVIEQVRYHRDLAEQQRRRIGKDRFWTVDYDDFCRDPNGIAARVAADVLGSGPPQVDLAPFTPSRNVRIDAATFERLEHELGAEAGA